MEQEFLQSIHDSIATTLPILREMAENSNPSPYTIHNIRLTEVNIVISILAFICSMVGVYYGWKGYRVSKMTAIGVERISPNTQQSLILEYFRSILGIYLRLKVVESAATKRNPPQFPKLSTVSSMMLPDWKDYYYDSRFQQFRGCVLSQDSSEYLPIETVQANAALESTLRLKRLEVCLQTFENVRKVFTDNLKETGIPDIHLNKELLNRLNYLILHNYDLLSFIDAERNSMSQFRIYLGRSAVLDYLYKLKLEVTGFFNNEESIPVDEALRINEWIPIAEEMIDDENLFIYRLLHHNRFDLEEYLKQSPWSADKVLTEETLHAELICLFSRLLYISSRHFRVK